MPTWAAWLVGIATGASILGGWAFIYLKARRR